MSRSYTTLEHPNHQNIHDNNTTVTAPSINKMADNSDSGGEVKAFVFYHYTPSMAAAIIFILIFGGSALFHIYQLVRSRTWYFIPFVLGCLCEYTSLLSRP